MIVRKASSKILAVSVLKKRIATLRKTKPKLKIVFTNGVFDLLHRGHVTYLEKARLLGDVLVVALNSDASVKRLKGPSRPINPLEDRQWVLASLECVDYVTSFDDDTPLKTVEKILPDVLVKGGDYSLNTIVGADVVLAHGGKVRVISFVAGRSTTKMIEKAKQGTKK